MDRIQFLRDRRLRRHSAELVTNMQSEVERGATG